MKTKQLASLAMAALAGTASAQSSVTISGVFDAAARRVGNGPAGSLNTLSNDGNSASRLIFRGSEDIGGGLGASFWLESQFGPDTGSAGGPAGGAWWNRRSTVSLTSPLGELRLGRDYTPTFWNFTLFDPFGHQGVGASVNLIGQATAGSGGNVTSPLGVIQGGVLGPAGDPRYATYLRDDNSIGYFLPALGGVYGQLMVAAGENRPGAKYVGGRLGYAAGPVNVASAYGKTNLLVGELTHFNMAGSYDLGVAKLYALWSKFKVDASEPVVGGRDQTNWLVGTTVPAGPGTFKLSYAQASGHISSAASTTDAKQLAVGYVYDLSKRTAIYTTASSVKNGTGARFVASGSGVAPGANTGFTSSGYEIGVRHNF